MKACALLAELPVAWEEEPGTRPVARGRAWVRAKRTIESWLRGSGRLLLVVGEWGAGKSTALGLVEEEAARLGLRAARVHAKDLVGRGVGGGADVVLVDQAEDVVLGGDPARFIEALSRAAEESKVAVALTPASLDWLEAELAWRERLGWLTRRATVVRLGRLARDEFNYVVASILAGRGARVEEVLEPPALSALYLASAGNPGVALKILREAGSSSRCPLDAEALLEAMASIEVPSGAGYPTTAVNPRVLDAVEAAASRCGPPVFEAASGAVLASAPEGLAECLVEAGLQPLQGPVYTLDDRGVNSLFAECERQGCDPWALSHYVYYNGGSWLAIDAWDGAPPGVREALRSRGSPAGPGLVVSPESLSSLYPRLHPTPYPFIPDESLAAAVDARVREAIASGKAAGLVKAGVVEALRAAGLARGGYVELWWRGARYRAPLTVFYAPEEAPEPASCDEPRAVIAVAPDGWKGSIPQCTGLVEVRLPQAAIRQLAAAGYARTKGVPVDEDALTVTLRKLASAHGLAGLRDRVARALEEAHALAPPTPPLPHAGDPEAAGYAALMLAMLARELGGLEALGEFTGRVEGLLALERAERLCRVDWAPRRWAASLRQASPVKAAEASLRALEPLGLAGPGDPMASRLARLGPRGLLYPVDGGESRAFIEGAARALREAGNAARARSLAAKAVAQALREASRLAAEAGSPEASRRLAHTAWPADGRAGVTVVFLRDALEALDGLASQAPQGRAVAAALSSAYEALARHAGIALEALRSIRRPRRQAARLEPGWVEAALKRLGAPEAVAARAKAVAEESLAALEPDSMYKSVLRAALERALSSLETGEARLHVQPACNARNLNLFSLHYHALLEEAEANAARIRRALEAARRALERALEAFSELAGLGLEETARRRVAEAVSEAQPADAESLARLAEQIARSLEAVLPGARLLAALKREVAEKAEQALGEARRLREEARQARRKAEEAAEEAGAAARLPALEAVSAEVEAAARAVAAEADAAEAVAARLEATAEAAVEAVRDAGVGLAERLALRIGEALREAERAGKRLSEALKGLEAARRALSSALASEASAAVDEARRLAGVAGRLGLEEAYQAASRAELAALAAADEAESGSLARASSLLYQALSLLSEARRAVAARLGEDAYRLYEAVAAVGSLDYTELVERMRGEGLAAGRVAELLHRLAEAGLVRVVVRAP